MVGGDIVIVAICLLLVRANSSEQVLNLVVVLNYLALKHHFVEVVLLKLVYLYALLKQALFK